MRHLHATAALLVLVAGSAGGQIQAQCGFNVTPLANTSTGSRYVVEAIRNPAYGDGVILAEQVGSTINLFQVDATGASLFKSFPISPGALLRDVRFDTTPGTGFSDLLYVSVSNESTTLRSIAPDGTIATCGTFAGSSSNGTCLKLAFSNPTAGYLADHLYMSDVCKTTSFWISPPSCIGTQISSDLLPPGRTDMDVGGMEFDHGGAFGNLLYLADSDGNCDEVAAIYQLMPNYTWATFVGEFDTDVISLVDLAISNGGALGKAMYVNTYDKSTTPTSYEVRRYDPNGNYEVFASGFSQLRKLSVSDDGSTLYVADLNQLYAIRGKDTLSGNPASISLTSGGTHTLTLDAECHPSELYLMLGSTSGTSPGVALGDVCVPVNPDPYFDLITSGFAGAVLSPWIGFLNPSGAATVQFTLPPGLSPALAGLDVSHAFVLAGTPFASNAVTVTLVP